MDNPTKTLIIIIAAVFLGFAIMNPWRMSYNMMTGFGFGGIFMVLLLVAIVLLIIWLMQQIQKSK